jgi:hypothetical protein
MDIIVIRINPSGELVSARPCYNCLDMMKAAGIRKVHYSVKDKIITEKVSNMVSINASSVFRHIEKQLYNAPQNDTDYYKRLLLTKFPKYIYKTNLKCFLEHNVKNVLPHFKWNIQKNKIVFYDNNDKLLLQSVIL